MAITVEKLNVLRGTVTTLALGGTSLGPTTEDGVNVAVAQDVRRVMCDQIKGPIDGDLVNREVTVQVSLIESDITKFHAALNLSSASLSDSSLTVDDSQASKGALTVVGVAPGGNARSFIFDEVLQVSNVDYAQKKGDDASLSLDFLAVYSVDNSRFFIAGDAA